MDLGGETISFLGYFIIDFMKLITWNIQGLYKNKCMLERKNFRQEFKGPSYKGVPFVVARAPSKCKQYLEYWPSSWWGST